MQCERAIEEVVKTVRREKCEFDADDRSLKRRDEGLTMKISICLASSSTDLRQSGDHRENKITRSEERERVKERIVFQLHNFH